MTKTARTRTTAPTEAAVQHALDAADAALAVAGHEASDYAREVTARRLCGELTSEEAVALIVAAAKQ